MIGLKKCFKAEERDLSVTSLSFFFFYWTMTQFCKLCQTRQNALHQDFWLSEHSLCWEILMTILSVIPWPNSISQFHKCCCTKMLLSKQNIISWWISIPWSEITAFDGFCRFDWPQTHSRTNRWDFKAYAATCLFTFAVLQKF